MEGSEKMSWEDIIKSKRSERYMFMRSPQQALDIIAALIDEQAPLKEQDAWLEEMIKLGRDTPDRKE